ncbi:unnamed protein product [Cuscuta campestris]|uniref:Uncharacterized protein n=1 Tax=Cuscuta campestris TaxID=132261 RepID=A0A484M702_9ASTE|nr:unnamed protein product [Cuscuta campestris]
MQDGVLKATSGALVMLKGVRKNNLYYYQGSTVEKKRGRTKDYGVRQYRRKGTKQSRTNWSSNRRRRSLEELSAATSRRPLGSRCSAAELADNLRI